LGVLESKINLGLRAYQTTDYKKPMTKNFIQPTTLVEILRHRAQNQPNKTAYTFLKDGETQEVSLTYAQLDQRARAIAAKLQSIVAPGDRALLLYHTGLSYIAAFFGCLYAGVIAVPTYPPRRNRSDIRFQTIAANAQAKIVLTQNDIFSNLTERLTYTPELKNLHWLVTDNLTTEFADTWQTPSIDSNTLAFLQYTSGSTGTPKGVMVSHGNVLYNAEMFVLGFGHTENTIGVGWLPLFHDLGLIGNVLQSLYVGCPIVLMSPMAFLQKPFRWLQAISRYHASSSAGPNFAYNLCIQKITPEQKAKLDLSSWEVAANCAEPIRAETLDRFVATFKACGFRREAFYPGYGMAETTLFISGGLKTAKPVVCEVEKAALELNRVVVVPDGENTQKIVGCGQTWLDQKILIVDPETFIPCSSPQVGEIWIKGQNVAIGYWNRPEETEQTFHAYLADTGDGPFLRTGDFGFLKEGELFVTGRLKDLIIIRGRNYYPQDIELSVEKSHPALNAGGCAVFSVEREGEERLVVAQEVECTALRKLDVDELDVDEVVNAIRQAVSSLYELQVYAVLLLKTATIPKTSSGKIQRHACRTGFLDGTLKTVGSWQQDISIKEEETVVVQGSRMITPETIQAWLLTQISQHLKITPSEIDVRGPLARYGIDSKTAVSLSGELETWLERPLSPTLVYDYPNIESLSWHLSEGTKETVIDFNAEVVLDSTIQPSSVPVEAIAKPHSIFLTGATGFLGTYLLYELLAQTTADIYCLVRAENADEGKQRLQNKLEIYPIWNETFNPRIIPVVGELSQPLLGLSESRFEHLASQIDVIYHNAAIVNFAYSYLGLKATNVLGTQEVLKLANNFQTKPVHFISTTGVFSIDDSNSEIRVVRESDIDDIQALNIGYSQSKWVAEKLVMQARERGLPVCIYRPSRITWHSQTGVTHLDDLLNRTIKGCIQLGKVPYGKFEDNMIPVDYVSRAIIHLSQQTESLGKTFHLTNPHLTNWDELFNWFRLKGYTLEQTSYTQWRSELSYQKENALFPLLSLFYQESFSDDQPLRWPQFDRQNTIEGLAGTHIVCPPIDTKLLDIYFSYLRKRGFLEAPPLRR